MADPPSPNLLRTAALQERFRLKLSQECLCVLRPAPHNDTPILREVSSETLQLRGQHAPLAKILSAFHDFDSSSRCCRCWTRSGLSS